MALATQVATAEAVEEVTAVPAEAPSDGAAISAAAVDLDTGALSEKQDPERLLRYYANALRAGDWIAANHAWSSDAQMTPDKLRDLYGNAGGVKIAVGKGDTAGAAGSIYYEAPVVLDFSNGQPSQRGTIVLRRANDVPGASAEQLVWRIARSSIVRN